jgi:hypothetical protein
MNYQEKYIKYKEKYINLNNTLPLIGGFSKKERPSPSESATLFNVGTEKKGNDGNIWIVKQNKNKIKKWIKYTSIDKPISKLKNKNNDNHYPSLSIGINYKPINVRRFEDIESTCDLLIEYIKKILYRNHEYNQVNYECGRDHLAIWIDNFDNNTKIIEKINTYLKTKNYIENFQFHLQIDESTWQDINI